MSGSNNAVSTLCWWNHAPTITHKYSCTLWMNTVYTCTTVYLLTDTKQEKFPTRLTDRVVSTKHMCCPFLFPVYSVIELQKGRHAFLSKTECFEHSNRRNGNETLRWSCRMAHGLFKDAVSLGDINPDYNFVSDKRYGLVESWTSWRLKIGPICCPETSVQKYHPTLSSISEERRSHLHRGRSLKSFREGNF
jgi:hypothetical protein